jgi:hypothetical protein
MMLCFWTTGVADASARSGSDQSVETLSDV